MRPLTAGATYRTWLVLSLTWAVSPVAGRYDRQPSRHQLVNNSDLIIVGAFQLVAVDGYSKAVALSLITFTSAASS